MHDLKGPAWPGLFILCAALAAAPAHGTEGDAWQFSLQTVHHADAVTLRDVDGDPLRSLAPRAGRNLAYLDDEARSSRVDGAWRWSLLARGSATLVVNRDALELAAQVRHALPADADRHWNTEVRFRGFTGGGIELERGFEPGGGWRLRASVQALVLRHWRERRIDGPVDFAAASGTYSFDLQASTLDDRLDEPFQRGFASRGAGLLFGGEAAWQGERWRWSLSARDAGWLRWHGVPQQTATLSTATQSYDADGFVIYKPLVQGLNHQDGRTQANPVQLRLRADWQLDGSTQLGAWVDRISGYGLLPGLAWSPRLGELQLQLAWQVHERRATLSTGWRGWQCRVGMDRPGAGQHSRELALSYSWPR